MGILAISLIVSATLSWSSLLSIGHFSADLFWLKGFAFEAHETLDERGNRVDFYLSQNRQVPAPIVLYIQGSGCTSHFRQKGDGSIGSGYPNLLLHMLGQKAHLLIVEKPHVRFLDTNPDPGSAIYCSRDFNEYFTAENWLTSLRAALRESRKMRHPNRIIVMGHSEGALIAAAVAAEEMDVTHAALLSGAGLSQLFDFVVNRPPDEVTKAHAIFHQVMSDPTSSNRFLWGHPYRRWSSFILQSAADHIIASKSQVMLLHGTEDRSATIQAFDSLTVELLRKRRTFIHERWSGADHQLNKPGEKTPQGMINAFQRVIEWSLSADADY